MHWISSGNWPNRPRLRSKWGTRSHLLEFLHRLGFEKQTFSSWKNESASSVSRQTFQILTKKKKNEDFRRFQSRSHASLLLYCISPLVSKMWRIWRISLYVGCWVSSSLIVADLDCCVIDVVCRLEKNEAPLSSDQVASEVRKNKKNKKTAHPSASTHQFLFAWSCP